MQGSDNFRDLVNGRIDIVAYLNSNNCVGDLSADNIPGFLDEVLNGGRKTMLTPADVMNHNIYARSMAAQGTPPTHPLRLPESPPETDSGAGSTGSPSGSSEPSSYSPTRYNIQQPQGDPPAYQNHQNNGVIHPPPSRATSIVHHRPNGDVQGQQGPEGLILSVPELNGSTGQLQNPALPSNQSIDAFLSPSEPSPRLQPNGTAAMVIQQAMNPAAFSPNYSLSNGCQQAPQISPSYPISGNACMDGQSPSPLLSRKRGRFASYDDPYGNMPPSIKPEPISPLLTDDMMYEEGFTHQAIRFSEFQRNTWHMICDANGRELTPLGFHIVADKGFNFSPNDQAFINQKKNHFQVTIQIEVHDRARPKFVRVNTEAGTLLKPIADFRLDFYGVKSEMPSSMVQIKQSQSDRKPIIYQPIPLDLPPGKVTKVTVQRLHFSETTLNNQRKNGRPNPDQKYFQLVVSLNALVQGSERYTIMSYASERVIVRASNPGQFDNTDTESHWQRGATPGSICYQGPVGIGTSQPQSALHVHGDMHVVGKITSPSDVRLKHNIEEVNTSDALRKLSQMRIVRYDLRPEVLERFNLTAEDASRVGVIAQEVEPLFPDAVKRTEGWDYLRVDENALFFESAAAVKELCHLTGNLESKIDEVSKIANKCNRLREKLKRVDSFLSLSSAPSNLSRSNAAITSGNYSVCGSQASVVSYPTKNPLDAVFARKPSKHQCNCALGNRRKPCKNRLLQGTIVCLVGIMAMCLLAMASLYILDWHGRHVDSDLQQRRDFEDNLAPATNGSGDPADSGGFGHMVKPGDGDPAHESGPNFWSVDEARQKMIHAHCPSDKTSTCPTFCCPKDTEIVRSGQPVDDKELGRSSYGVLNASNATRYRRDAGASTVEVTIPSLNMTRLPHAEYCRGCSDPAAGRLTYLVPVSRHMPIISLTVQFRISDDRSLSLCEHDLKTSCDSDGQEPKQVLGPVQMRSHNQWELPIGAYLHSSYTFRLAYSSPCMLSESDAGVSFQEIKLEFYRACDVQ